MNGMVLPLAKTIWASLRQTPSARQTAFAAAALLWLASASSGQERETPKADRWNAIFAAIRQPRDTVVRQEGANYEPPLALTPDQIRDPANGIVRVERFETKLLQQIDEAIQIQKEANFEQAEKSLEALWRTHQSWRLAQPGSDPWRSLRIPIEEKLSYVRHNLLHLWQQTEPGTSPAKALAASHQWLATHGNDSRLGAAIKQLWLNEAKRLADAKQSLAAREWLDRLIAEFGMQGDFEAVRESLRKHAESLLKEAGEKSGAEAGRLREQASRISPEMAVKLPPTDASTVLHVLGRSLPRRLSPGPARSDDEVRCFDLLFEPLGNAAESRTFDPLNLSGTATFRNRRWPHGETITAKEVQDSIRSLGKTTRYRLLLAELLDSVQADQNELARSTLRINLRQGVFPWQDLAALPLVPHILHGAEMNQWENPSFPESPSGSGPFQLDGVKNDVMVFYRNQHYRLPIVFEQVRYSVAKDIGSAVAANQAQIAFDLTAQEADAAKKTGWSVRSANVDRGWFLAMNHRRPLFADVAFRRGLAYAVDRESAMKANGFDADGKSAHALNGPYPFGSWASGNAPQVPASLHHMETAIAHLRKSAEAKKAAKLEIRFAQEWPDAEAACKTLASQLNLACEKSDVPVRFEAKALPTAEFFTAIDRHEFDLAYLPLDGAADLWRLWSVLDRSDAAFRQGGANFSGFSDARMESLFRTAIASRRFPAVRDAMANIHAYWIETMPMIPLWQAPMRYAVSPSLDVPPLDPRHPFVAIESWKRTK